MTKLNSPLVAAVSAMVAPRRAMELRILASIAPVAVTSRVFGFMKATPIGVALLISEIRARVFAIWKRGA